MSTKRVAITWTCVALFTAAALAAETPSSAATGGSAQSNTELSKQTQNPVSDLTSVPFQNNFGFDAGSDDDLAYTLNFQPVMPTPINDDWNLINRAIMPVISQPLGDGETEFGLGDLNYTAFLSPRNPEGIVWGIGPIIQLPTATSQVVGTGKWAIGPSGVGVLMSGPWVVGLLTSQLWSFAGDSGRASVSSFLLQPFVNYNLPDGWALSTAPLITASWEANESQRWTVPIGGGVSKTFKAGKLPMSAVLQYYENVDHPALAPERTLRVVISLLFPQ